MPTNSTNPPALLPPRTEDPRQSTGAGGIAVLVIIALVFVSIVGSAFTGGDSGKSHANQSSSGPDTTNESDIKDWLCNTKPTDSIDYSDC